MDTIFNLCKNRFEILEFKSIQIDYIKNQLEIKFPKNKITIIFNQSSNLDIYSQIIKFDEATVFYTCKNIKQYLEDDLMQIIKFPNQNLFLSFDINKNFHFNSNTNKIDKSTILKVYLIKHL